MKTLFFQACTFLALSLPVFAEVIGVEQFDYPDGALAGKNGGIFWDYKNTAPAGRSGTASTWSNLNGAPNVASGQLVTSGNGAVKRAYNGNTETTGAINDANVAKTVYYRVNVTTGPSVTAGDYFGISSMDGGTEKLYFGKRGTFPNWGVEEVGVGGTNGSLAVQPNTTYTLVVQVDLTDNVIRLYVNPNLSAAQFSNSATASQNYTGNAASTAVRFAAGTAVTWDNLVIATTWEELQVTVVTTLADEDNGSITANTSVSLREAVKYSPTGSLITFDSSLSGKTIILTHPDGDMEIPGTLTIDASALPGGLTVSGNNTSRHFLVGSGKSLTLHSLTLSGGNGVGAPYFQGGAITNLGTLTLTHCTLSGNTASLDSGTGGAIASGGSLTLTNCTLSGNAAPTGSGGAIASGGSLTLTNCTLSGNAAPTGSGGAISIDNGGTVTLTNTLIAENTASSSPDIERNSGTIITNGVNLIGNLAGSTLNASTTILTGDPKLSPLGYFGGPVQTLHPLIGSPAIDAAGTNDPGGTDARGFPRIVDGDTASAGAQLDIGAVEAGPLRTVDSVGGASPTGLRATILASTEPGARIGFLSSVFPATPIEDIFGEFTIAAGRTFFIDASSLSGPVTISGRNLNRVFNISATATVAMHSVRIVNGQAPNGDNGPNGEDGGGIFNSGSLSLFSCTLSGNAAGTGEDAINGSGGGGNGGGIFSSGTLSLTACTLSSNAAGAGGIEQGGGGSGGGGGGGGGIFSSGTLNLTACTLSSNAAGAGGESFNGSGGTGGGGGGIFSSGTLSLTACTLAENRTGSGGPGFPFGSNGAGGGISGGIAILENCLIAENSASGTARDVNVATLIYLSANLLGTAANVSGSGTAPIINPNALLAPLADNGGPTQTMALLPGSPARGAGGASARTPDQRGFPIVGTPDIGAYEAQIGPIADVTMIENSAPPTRNFSVGQIGTLTATSSNTALVPNASIVLSGSGASRSVTVTPAAGQLGSAVITLTDSLSGETQTFTLTVNLDPAFIVTSTNDGDPGSLRQAMVNAATAAGPNTITFAPGFTGPITLSSEILINDVHPVVVDASSVSGGLLLNAGPNSRHFQVPAGKALTLRGMTLQGGNAGGDGGSIYNEGAVILERCTLINNHSNFGGGAVDSRGPLFRAVDCSFSENTSRAEGGGIRCRGAVAELTRCTISGNGSCGLVLFSSVIVPQVTVTLIQCTVVNNTSSGISETGGIRALSGTLNLIHCTISGNSSTSGSGGLFISQATVTTTNCIIAGNTSTGGAPPDISITVSGTLKPRGANLIGSNQSVEASFPAGPLVGTAAAPLNADLSPFGDYGGPTATLPPNVNSPAIDQASTLSPALVTDQRGLKRPMGIRPDIGAVESSVIIVNTPVDELDPPGLPGNGVSLREAVRDVPLNGTIGFDRAIFNSPASNTITLTKGPLNPQQACVLDGSINRGPILVDYAPEITQQLQPASVTAGAPVSFSMTVTALSGGLAREWFKNGVGTGINTPVLNFPNAQEADEGVYYQQIIEAPAATINTYGNVILGFFIITSQPASLTVDGAPVTILRNPVGYTIDLGGSHTLSVIAVGPAPLSYQWFKAGKAIAGATKSSYTIPKAALSHAGAYTCVVKTGSTAPGVTSSAAEISVVDTRERRVSLKAGSSFTATVIAAGNGLSYQWNRMGSGDTTKTLTINSVSVADAGQVSCDVNAPSDYRLQGGIVELFVSNAAPALVTPLATPTAYIGQHYFYQLPVVYTPGAPAVSFSLTGALPSGMTFDKTFGILSGRPSVTKSAGYALSFKAINASGSSAAATATLKVNVVPPSAVGVFAGPLERSPLNDNLGGRFDLTTTATGLCSGSVTLGARAKLSFTNQLLLSAGAGDAILRVNIPGLKMADKTPLTAYLEVFATDQTARLTLLHPNGGTLLATAWRNSWSKTRPATAYASTYTARLDPANVGNPPRGYGFATLLVKPDGTLTLTGKLPDGSGLTQAGFVGPEGQLTVFNLLNFKRGSLVGPLQIIPEAPVANNTLGGTLDWLKLGPLPKSTDTVYQAGFGPLAVTVEGSPYIAPAKGQRVLGLDITPNPNAKLDFTLGGLAQEFAQLLYITNPSATGLTNKGTLTLPLTNATKLTTLDSAKGQFKGSFVINGASIALNRPAPFFGQIVKIGATTQGYGYFLLPSVPVGAQKVTTSPKLSGRVVLGAP